MTLTPSFKGAVVTSLLVVSSAFAGLTRAGEGEASFKAVGPAGFKLEGKTRSVDVKDDGKAIMVVVSLKDLETGIALRDAHMREKYLEVDKFPDATLAVGKDQVTWPDSGKSSAGQARGTFTVHGVSKDVSFKYRITNSDGTYAIEGEAAVNFKDHGVSVPSYMGITVKPDITIVSKFNAKQG